MTENFEGFATILPFKHTVLGNRALTCLLIKGTILIYFWYLIKKNMIPETRLVSSYKTNFKQLVSKAVGIICNSIWNSDLHKEH